MTPKIRILALAAMGLGAAMSVQAAPTVIDIDFHTQATNAGLTPTAAASEQGFAFTGATVYNQNYFTSPAASGYPTDYPTDTATSGTGFIQNRFGNNGTDVTNLEISFDIAGDLVGGDIDSVAFSLAGGATANVRFLIHDATNHKWIDKDTFGSSTAYSWNPQSYDFKDLVIDRIKFEMSAGQPSTFALDNFRFTLADAGTGGGSVPEPAGLGLVALAFVAAGIATRKRRT